MQANKKKLTFQFVGGEGKESGSITYDASQQGNTTWKVGRQDQKKGQKPEIDLGKDSKCSRESGTIRYFSNTFTYEHVGQCNAGYIVDNNRFQILEGQVLDFGGKQNFILFCDATTPSVQLEKPEPGVCSPLSLLEGRTEGIINRNPTQPGVLRFLRLDKKSEVPVNLDDNNILETPHNISRSWTFGRKQTAKFEGLENVFKGVLELGYQAPTEDNPKGYWYIRVVEADENCPIVQLFRNKEQFLNPNKTSDPYTLINGLRALVGAGQYLIKIE